MNQIKRVGKMLAIVLVLSMVIQLAIPNYFTAVANAATIAINPQKVTLEVGKSKTLKITGTKTKAVWSSSNTKIAAVSNTGKVVAKKAGKAKITATINKKKYTCAVTVKEAKKTNPLVDAAPFKAQAATTADFTYIFPGSWSTIVTDAGAYQQVYMAPTSAIETGNSSNLVLALGNLDSPIDAETLKMAYQQVTADLLVSQFAQLGMEVTIDNLAINPYKNSFGLGYAIKYDISYGGVSMKQTIYDIYTDKHEFKVTITDIGDKLSPDVNKIADYLIKTMKISE
ncbi:Ig-like domain-containing protein [Anaerocolumna xylanovorans]|uniref:Ig-like domain (Group 2) n=1 Tax=Anaerocolumna xylanovorans DSM 12503 TaxID=1121345 RepID=A0A1M7Y1U5_9FIRM|nr:Ig-like domain-containing protein [Anaerocolumna xylanovorans]SHO45549.1 Ig-like domain (group 2) [Anaerocolumna xylanovorans DSM 12503]